MTLKFPKAFSHVLFGLLAGAAVASVHAAEVSTNQPLISLKLVTQGLTSPLSLWSLPDKSGRKVVADQAGVARIIEKDGTLAEKLFLDLRPQMVELTKGFDERGFICMTFHPQAAKNRKFYAVYSAPRRASAPTNYNSTLRLSEFKVSATDWTQADSASERVILEVDKPAFNHNCGRIAFGPDGFLYMGVGDGGDGNDTGLGHGPNGNGQDTHVILGKILRLDVDHGSPYGIPRDNPFADGKRGLPEIYAYGVRNSWGLSFDRGGKHELFAADVGQNLFEEVNIITKGGNYGWRLREGMHGFDPAHANAPAAETPVKGLQGEPLIDPILEYKNANGWRKDPEARGISITGGYVYRGKAIPQLQGKYIFADWSKNWALGDGQLFAGTRPADGKGPWSMEVFKIANLPGNKLGGYIVAMGEDENGELYVLVNGTNLALGSSGRIYQIIPN